MPDSPFKIVIVGGGTAGWLTAAFLGQQLPLTTGQAIKITLVEASDIPTIGVGEATVPSIKETLAACGIPEIDFLRECDATFKHGIKFVNWRRSPEEDPGESYFHPFGDPLTIGAINPARQWSKLPVAERGAFADLFSVQPEMAETGRAPKHLKDRPYDGALAYAYHLDAGKLAEFLKRRCKAKGVRHIIDTVETVKHENNNEAIRELELASGQTLKADLFIDCTGFAARLINADKKNIFVDKTSVLFVDRAVTLRVPHNGVTDINGYTTCTAQTAGWIWDIVLQKRRGVGHVYSSKHMTDDDAKIKLAKYLNLDANEIDARFLKMRIGYHAQQWRGNCVAIGLASGFLEPLESTGIYLTEMANWALAEMIPRFIGGSAPQKQFNGVMGHHYENIVDFLKLHYALSGRDDTDFWRHNRDPVTWPDTLKNHLKAWQNDIPSIYDFDRTIQCFSSSNYQFVLFGMEWASHNSKHSMTNETAELMRELATRRERLRQFVVRDTIPNAEIFKTI